MEIEIKRLSETAQLPTQSYEGAAGWDLYANEAKHIAAGSRETIKTGISIAFPEGNVALIKDRSGLAAKHGLTVLAGVMDADYRGEYLVVLLNTSKEDYEIKEGDRIAQAVFLPLLPIKMKEVEQLSETLRGEGRYGSSGY